MRVASIVLPVLVLSAIGGAFFAGRYIGQYDTEQRYSLVIKMERAADNADKLRIAGAAADMLRNSNPAGAARVLDQYAQVHASSVASCLRLSSCAAWVAPTSESQATLQRYVAAYESPSASKSNR